MASLIQQYMELERKYKNLSQAYIELKTKNETLQKEYNRLKKEVDILTCECSNKTCQYRIPNSHVSDEIISDEVNIINEVDNQNVDEIQDEQPDEIIKETTKKKRRKDNNIKE